MKLKYLLMGALVGVAFTACTSDDEPTVNNGEKFVNGLDKYVAVHFQMPGNATTRTLDGFALASEDEVAVDAATFMFFNGENQVAAPYSLTKKTDDQGVEHLVDAEGNTLDPWTDHAEGETVDKTSSPVIVMKNPSAYPTELVVLLNYDGAVSQSMTLTQLEAVVADYATGKQEKGKFVMSNSVYYDASGNEIVGAPVTSANIFEDPKDAKNAPVEVYVERVLAKVDLALSDNLKTNSGNDDITITVDGWWLGYENTQSYLVKNLSESYNFGANIDATWWNDAANFRSYWADAAEYKVGNHKITDAVAAGTSIYTQENTAFMLTNPDASKPEGPTVAVVAATLKYKNAAVDLFSFRGAVYPEDGIITLMANSAVAHQYYKEGTGGTYVSLDPSDFILEKDATAGESYEAAVNLKLVDGITTVYTITSVNGNQTATEVTAAEANAALAKYTETVEYWNGGRTYYFIPIVQNSALKVNPKDPKADPVEYLGLYGVVRNHWYQLTINSINGLGTAVPDPDEVIIPIIPEEKDYYIAAEINILQWKVVTQSVDLGK